MWKTLTKEDMFNLAKGDTLEVNGTITKITKVNSTALGKVFWVDSKVGVNCTARNSTSLSHIIPTSSFLDWFDLNIFKKLIKEEKVMKSFVKGDQIKCISTNIAGPHLKGEIYTFEEYDHETFSGETMVVTKEGHSSYAYRFELYKSASAPLKRDDIVNLEVTAEELILLRIFTGKCDGAIPAKNSLFTKVQGLLQEINKHANSHCVNFNGVTLSLVNVQGKFKDLVNTIFPPVVAIKTQEEIEYEKLQQQIAELQAQALKLKPKGN